MDSTLGGLFAENPCSVNFVKTPSASLIASSLSGLFDAVNALYIAFNILSLLKSEIDPFLLRIRTIEFSICDLLSTNVSPILVEIDRNITSLAKFNYPRSIFN